MPNLSNTCMRYAFFDKVIFPVIGLHSMAMPSMNDGVPKSNTSLLNVFVMMCSLAVVFAQMHGLAYDMQYSKSLYALSRV